MTIINKIDWDQQYKNLRDFKFASTSDVEIICSLIEVNHSAGKKPTFLDVGCGTGQLVREVFHRGFKATGIDTSNEAITIALRSSTFIGEGIDFSVGSAIEPFGKKYNLITCKHVIAFLDERTIFYKHILHAMEAASTFVIITPQKELQPLEKKYIAVDDSILLPELQNTFGRVDKISSGNDWWYVCQQ